MSAFIAYEVKMIHNLILRQKNVSNLTNEIRALFFSIW